MHALALDFHVVVYSIAFFAPPPARFCLSPSSMGSLHPCFLLTTATLFPIFFSQLYAFPVCLNKEAPVPLNTSLAFCSSYIQNDSSCCDAIIDQQLNSTFQSFNVSDGQCATYLKQVLCAQCDPYSGDLFQTQLGVARSAPVLCNLTSGSNDTSTSNITSKAYCENVWNACESAPIKNSPFATPGASQSAQNASSLTDIWQSQAEFCTALGGTHNSGDFCFDGGKFTDFNTTMPLAKLEGICFEKVGGNGSYLNMIPHPDGSNRVFVSSQGGKIWIATVPAAGSQNLLTVDESSPFLDISDRVISSGEYGLLGVAFHPDYSNNGRFFVSYNCDKTLWPDCAGRCACSADAGCTIANLGPEAGSTPCQISSVIAEYSVDTSSSSSSLKAAVANPDEVRRIFTMGLPYSTHHAGQILFGPIDNYLYFMMGDGGGTGDPFNFGQNKMSLLGKILRLDVDSLPSASEGSLQLWGNYSIPADNPFVQDNTSLPEIWAYGLRNPWRCAFDKIKPEYFYCADVGQESFEEVDLITKGGNYGWRVYEGTAPYTSPRSPGGNTSAASIQPILPILEYSHASVNPKQNSASITGGYVSRSTQDACLYGRYVYGDLYGGAMWAAAEMPEGSGNYTTTRANFACSADSPMDCKPAHSSEPNFLYLFSFGEDNYNNLYVLSAMGVYRVADPKGCGYTCNATLPPDAFVNLPPYPSLSPAPSPHTSSTKTNIGHVNHPTWTLLSITLTLLALRLFGF